MSSDRYITSITKLNGENYHDWKFAVSLALRQKGCWAVITGLEEEKPITRDAQKAWEQKSEEALTIIGLTVEPSQYTYIRQATDGITAWNALKDIYEKNSRSTRISLKRQFYGFDHDINAPIQKYITGITELAGKLKAIGVELTDEDIMDVLIFNLDTEYSNIAASLMTKDKLTITDITSTLIEEEQRKGGAPQSTDTATTLYSNHGDGKGPPCRRGPNRDRREGFTDSRKCYRCNRNGHIMKFCRATTLADGTKITPEMEQENKEASNMAYIAGTNSSLNDVTY